MLHAYHQMTFEQVQYAILSHHNVVDIGYVTLKEVTKFLATKYIPDQEIKGSDGTLIQIK